MYRVPKTSIECRLDFDHAGTNIVVAHVPSYDCEKSSRNDNFDTY